MAIKKKPTTKKPVKKDAANQLVDDITGIASKFIDAHKKPIAFFIGAATTDMNDKKVAFPMVSFNHGSPDNVGQMIAKALQAMMADKSLEPVVGTAILHTIAENQKLLRAVTEALPLLSTLNRLSKLTKTA